jgi:WD40 repeat protein
MHHVGPIAGVAAHGSWIASAGYDNRLILWDATSRRALARSAHDHLVNACAFSHDGRYLVSASSDYSARIWSLPDLRLIAVLGGHGDDVDMARFSPDDALVATCALDRIVRVFSASGALRHEMHTPATSSRSPGSTTPASSPPASMAPCASGTRKRRLPGRHRPWRAQRLWTSPRTAAFWRATMRADRGDFGRGDHLRSGP